jgi:Spy/CpxP family protein refolding chaperone
MKVMRIATLGVALLLAATTVADAQDAGGRRGGGRGGRGGVGALMQNITVTPDVQVKIDTIVAKYRAETMAIFEAAGGGGGGGGRGTQLDTASQSKVTAINSKRNAEIKALLTPDQQKTFDENVAAVAAGRGRRGGGGGGGAAPPPPPPPAR